MSLRQHAEHTDICPTERVRERERDGERTIQKSEFLNCR